MSKTLNDFREQADQIVGRIFAQGVGSVLFGGSGRDAVKDGIAQALLSAYEDGVRAGEAKRAAKKRKAP